MPIPPICEFCEYYQPGIDNPDQRSRCVAFPDGIPTEITQNLFDHRQRFAEEQTLFRAREGVTEEQMQDWADLKRILQEAAAGSFRPEQSENVWVGTDRGLACLDGDHWTTFTTEDGLTHDWIQALAVDAKGVLWVGTHSGLCRFDGHAWMSFTTADGLANHGPVPTRPAIGDPSGRIPAPEEFSNSIRAVAVGADGEVWVGSPGGLSRFNGDRWVTYATEHGLGSTDVLSIAVAGPEDVWVICRAGQGADLYHYDGERAFDGQRWVLFKKVDVPLQPTADSGWKRRLDPTVVCWFSDEDLWVGSSWGLSRFDGQTWETFEIPGSPLGLESICTIAIDSNGDVWAGVHRAFERGETPLFVFDGQNWYDGRPPVGLLGAERVRSLAFSNSSGLWAGVNAFTDAVLMTTPSGVVGQFDGLEWRICAGNDQLPGAITALTIGPSPTLPTD